MDMTVDNEKGTWLDLKTRPMFRRSRHLKDLISHIANGGGSSHSAYGQTLGLTIRRLEQAGISYQLTAHPGYGYYLQGIPKEDWMNKNER